MKLIKINPDCYVIVDHLEIKEGDYFMNETNTIEVGIGNYDYKILSPECKKIIYSTQPLGDNKDIKYFNNQPYYKKDGRLSLSKVKKVIGELDMEELELKYRKQLTERREIAKNFRGQVAGNHPDMFTSREMLSMMEGFTDGYTQALEDNKDRKYTEKDINDALSWGYHAAKDEDKGIRSSGFATRFFDKLQPKTSWDVKFIDGELKLK